MERRKQAPGSELNTVFELSLEVLPEFLRVWGANQDTICAAPVQGSVRRPKTAVVETANSSQQQTMHSLGPKSSKDS